MPAQNKPSASAMFLPALLDRLSQRSGPGHEQGRHMSRSAYRQSVLRDLQWLLNCPNLEAQLPFDRLSYARRSVLNYGIPAFAGANFTDSDLLDVAKAIKEAIACYEPRVVKDTLSVSIVREQEESLLHNKALFKIEASLWFEPYPIDLTIRAQWDSENGNMQLQDVG